MKTIFLLLCPILVIGCASKQPKQDPVVAVIQTTSKIESSQKSSGDSLQSLKKSLERAEKFLDEAERQPK